MDPKKIADYTERTWYVGTDILCDDDIELLDTTELHNIRNVPSIRFYVGFLSEGLDAKLAEEGFSPDFVALVREARERGYKFLELDRAIETTLVEGEEDMSADQLKAKYGGSCWDEHPDFPRDDWKEEAYNDETVIGYWDWVASQVEMRAEDEE